MILAVILRDDRLEYLLADVIEGEFEHIVIVTESPYVQRGIAALSNPCTEVVLLPVADDGCSVVDRVATRVVSLVGLSDGPMLRTLRSLEWRWRNLDRLVRHLREGVRHRRRASPKWISKTIIASVPRLSDVTEIWVYDLDALVGLQRVIGTEAPPVCIR